MNTIKVKHTEAYKHGQIDTIVCKGKLVLIKQEKDIIFPCISSNLADSDWRILNGLVRSPRYYYKPIIISETEPITENTKTINEGLNGDFYYNTIYKSIAQTGDITKYDFKVLSMSENFSPEHLQAIVNSKLKDGDDEVLVECTDKLSCSEGENCTALTQEENPYKGDLIDCMRIKMDKQNHITLFLILKEYSWDELSKGFAAWAWGKEVPDDIDKLQSFFKRFVDEVAALKFYPPTKK